MRQALRRILYGSVLFASCAAVTFAADHGHHDPSAIENWSSRDFKDAQSPGQPLCVYIYDPQLKKNPLAKVLESGEFAGNAEVRQKSSPFLRLKLKSDKTDVVGWPQDLLAHGSNGAALLLCSSDFRKVLIFDKSTPHEQLNVNTLLMAIKTITAYEDAQKKRADKHAAAVAAKEPEPPQRATAPGLEDHVESTSKKAAEKPELDD